jgi:hypothetical protein
MLASTVGYFGPQDGSCCCWAPLQVAVAGWNYCMAFAVPGPAAGLAFKSLVLPVICLRTVTNLFASMARRCYVDRTESDMEKLCHCFQAAHLWVLWRPRPETGPMILCSGTLPYGRLPGQCSMVAWAQISLIASGRYGNGRWVADDFGGS